MVKLPLAQALPLAFEHWRAGRWREARRICQHILTAWPDQPEALWIDGRVALQAGDLTAAEAAFRRAVAARPAFVEAASDLATLLFERGEVLAAERLLRPALDAAPGHADGNYNLGMLLAAENRMAEAEICFGRALALRPNWADAENNLGNVLLALERLGEAEAAYRRALAMEPNHAEACFNLGRAIARRAGLDEEMALYRRALDIRPDFAMAHSALLCCEQYLPGVSLARLQAMHAEWDRRHAAPLAACRVPCTNRRDADKRLHVGFVSPDLARHPVGMFVAGVLEALREESCELVIYNNRVGGDEITRRIAAAAHRWREIRWLSDEQVAEQIRGDEIDILFDLSGHTADNRLLVFARKPAPIQITWIGYEGTTGLSAMDYLIADRNMIPAGRESPYRESVVRLPDAYLCYDPTADAPPVSPLPAARAGQLTFGSFNNLAKIGPNVVEVWAEILRSVPRSRLVMMYRGLGDETVRRRYLDLFAAYRVEPARVLLLSAKPYAEYLAAYSQIDIALDAFPFSGSATTCDSLWMGVPVITCPGETFASRHGLTHLTNIGLTETIARDRDEYVELAVSLAGDLGRLAEMRARLREQMARSPLCDGKRFAANLMGLLRDAWRTWVSGV